MFAEELREEIAGVLRAGNPPDLRNPVLFVENLRFIYHTIRASAGLLAVAVEVSHGALRDYYLSHLEEEREHDEWLYQDLKSAGINPFPCPTLAAQLAGSQYYHLAHTNSVSLLGYMLVLEGFPLPLPVIEELEALHGKALLRTTRFHAEHDGRHSADLFAVINDLPSMQQAIVRQIALDTAYQVTNALRHIQGAL